MERIVLAPALGSLKCVGPSLFSFMGLQCASTITISRTIIGAVAIKRPAPENHRQGDVKPTILQSVRPTPQYMVDLGRRIGPTPLPQHNALPLHLDMRIVSVGLLSS